MTEKEAEELHLKFKGIEETTERIFDLYSEEIRNLHLEAIQRDDRIVSLLKQLAALNTRYNNLRRIDDKH